MEASVAASVGFASEADDDRRVEWHRLWVAVRRWRWSSLAVVPASRGNSAVRVARALMRVGSIHLGQSVELLDTSHIPRGVVSPFVSFLEAARAEARSVVVACPHPSDNEASIPVVLAADAVLLSVVLEEASFKGTRQIMDLFGPRIIGSVVLPRPT